MKDYSHKLDTSICEFCKVAAKNLKIPVIIFANKENRESVARKINALGGVIRYELEILGAYAVDLEAKKIEEIAKSEVVNYIASDSDASTRCDSVKGSINYDNKYNKYTGEGVNVAVIDTGIYPHDDLIENNSIMEFVDFVSGKKKAYDDNGHGTHVSGIIASSGKNSDGRFSGIAPNSKLIGLKALNASGSGKISDILAAMDWVYKNKDEYNIKILSMSLGSSTADIMEHDPMALACERLWDSGVTIIAAAGNSGPRNYTIDSPGASGNVIAVGAVDHRRTKSKRDDIIAEFSSRGPSNYEKYKPDIVAPGVDVYSLKANSRDYVAMSGTSMATPVVSGCAALLLEKNPNMSPDEVKSKIKKSTVSLGYGVYDQGAGMIDLKKLLK